MPYDNDPNAAEHDFACPLCLKGKVPWCRECNDVSEECAKLVDIGDDILDEDDRAHARAASWVKCPLCGGDGELIVGDSWDADDAADLAIKGLRDKP